MNTYEQLEAAFGKRFAPESPLRELKMDPEAPEAVYRIDPQWAQEHGVTPQAVEEFFATHLQVPAADYCHYDEATGLVTLWDAPEEWQEEAEGH